MKNLSGNANWFKNDEIEIKEVEEALLDERVVLSYELNGCSYFLASEEKPLVFKNINAGSEYIEKNELVDYVIDGFAEFDFSGIEIIEV